MNKINWMDIILVKCDCCGEMTKGCYSRDGNQWFGKYLNPGEEKVCYNCIKNRPGYAEEFEKLIGISIEEMDKIKND